MIKFLNHRISTSLVIRIIAILIIAVVSGILVYQHGWLVKEKNKQPEVKILHRTSTPPEKILAITTNKTDYEFNEPIIVYIKNKSNTSLWYQMSECISDEPNLTLESYENKEWGLAMVQRLEPCHTGAYSANIKIKPGKEIKTRIRFPVSPGEYRLVLPMETNCLNDNDSFTGPCSCTCSGEKDIYSNEFKVNSKTEMVKEFTGTIVDFSAFTKACEGYVDDILLKTIDGNFYNIVSERKMYKEMKKEFKNKRVIIRGYLFDNAYIYRGACSTDLDKTIFITKVEAEKMK